MAAAAAGGWRGGVQGGPATGAAGLATLHDTQGELRSSAPALLHGWGREAGSLPGSRAWSAWGQFSCQLIFRAMIYRADQGIRQAHMSLPTSAVGWEGARRHQPPNCESLTSSQASNSFVTRSNSL